MPQISSPVRRTSGTTGVWLAAGTASTFGAGPRLSSSLTAVTAGSDSFSMVNSPPCTQVGLQRAETTAQVRRAAVTNKLTVA